MKRRTIIPQHDFADYQYTHRTDFPAAFAAVTAVLRFYVSHVSHVLIYLLTRFFFLKDVQKLIEGLSALKHKELDSIVHVINGGIDFFLGLSTNCIRLAIKKLQKLGLLNR